VSAGAVDPAVLQRRLSELVAEARAAGCEAELPGWLAAALAPRSGESAASPAAAAPVVEAELPGRFGMIGASPAMQAVYALIERVAQSDVPVLIRGETGSGKELVARALHRAGPRRRREFLAVNCAAVPANLLESELFGHVKGAFTGAVENRKGHFVVADGGTLLLDEIGDMPLEMQAKLLRVLQEGEVRAVGSSRTTRVDVRVLAATHRDLSAMCRAGTFREDLYFRLNVVEIRLPPLRERRGDVPLLVRACAGRLAAELGRPTPTFTPQALERLDAWRWPGNVRELENELRRAIALSNSPIGEQDLSPQLRAG
jgi:transcriptional regulator with GAF, ATPase, and Fis domain